MKKCNYNFKKIAILVIFTQLFTINAYANNSYPLNKKEIGILFRYFTDVYDDSMTNQDSLDFYNKKYSLFNKIIGKVEKKSEKEIKLYLSLLQMVHTYNDNSESDFVSEKLYERFLLQPGDYMNLVKYNHPRQDAFCYYLGRDISSYLVQNKIKPKITSRREYFKKMHSDDLEILGNNKNINNCLSKMPVRMPDQTMY